MSSNRTHSQWLNKCRTILIEMETKNIRQRALSWTEIVTTETTKINAMLAINISSAQPYLYSVPNPLKYLTFLSEWNGIKTRNTSSQPTSYVEFEAKAKNWLNGRRAPNYGNTLFPDMIKSVFAYSQTLAMLVFGTHTSKDLKNLYHKTLLFAYLSKLCSSRIAVHQSWKKTNLLCENSVKNMHSNTAKLLQQYAIHDYTANDLNSFPGNLQRSAAFFSEQHSAYMGRLVRAKNSHSNAGNVGNAQRRVIDSSLNYVAIKSADYASIMQRLSALERKHNEQANQISGLAHKCHALQGQIDLQPSSTIPSIPSVENENEYYNENSLHSHDTLSTFTSQPMHMPMPMPMPMPFQGQFQSQPLPPQIHIPQMNYTTANMSEEKNEDMKPNFFNANPSQITSSASMPTTPFNSNNNTNYTMYNCSDYGLNNNSTGFGIGFNMYDSNGNGNGNDTNENSTNVLTNDASMNAYTPNNDSNTNLFVSDTLMFEHNSTPNQSMFTYNTPLDYTH